MNTLFLIRQNDTGGPTHGGWQVRRHFILYANGLVSETFDEHSERWAYASGPYFNLVMARVIEKMEALLKTKCLFGKVLDFDPKAGVRDPHSTDALGYSIRQLAAL